MSDQHFETDSIRGEDQTPQQPPHTTPIYATSSFTFQSADEARELFADRRQGHVYSRYSNPNTGEFEQKMARLEKSQAAVATASGMSAVFASLAALLDHGDHLLASRALFGSTHQILSTILPRWGINYSYLDVDKPDEWDQHVQDNTRLLLLETPSNPGLELIDLEWVGEWADNHNLILCVDNCFATPYLQQPAEYGADLIIHSATKFIDGQGRALGGVIAGKTRYIEEIRFFVRHTGPTLSPFNAWIFSKSLETLPVRMERHCQLAYQLAEELEQHPRIQWVRYPFLDSHPQSALARKQMKHGGGILVFNLEGGYSQASQFLDNLDMISLSANLGDTRTIATHPSSTTHSNLTQKEQEAVGITPGMIRVAVGLEHFDDIRKDIQHALDQIK